VATAATSSNETAKLRTANCAAALIAKLKNVSVVSEADAEALRSACRSVHSVEARRDVIRDGDKPEHVHLMVEGWAARYKVLPDGSRQIMAFLIPGDFCDIHITILGEMDHGIVALTPVKVAYVERGDMDALAARPDLTRALWWATLVDEAVLRAWIVSLGRRDAYEATAHLFCELHQRMKNVGLVEDDQFDLPLTQEVLADALGLTPVHVNRSLKRLRRDGLIEIQQGSLAICDVQRLRKAAGFDPSYLHGAPDDAR
jgi:CRP-like cAMP-binding protein